MLSTRIYRYIYVNAYIHTCILICIHTQTHTHTDICITDTPADIHAYTHAHAYMCVYACVHSSEHDCSTNRIVLTYHLVHFQLTYLLITISGLLYYFVVVNFGFRISIFTIIFNFMNSVLFLIDN